MRDDGRLAVIVSHANGSVTGWSFDDVDAGKIPNDLNFSTATPGGFGTGSLSLLRDLEPRADEHLYDTVRFFGPGDRTAYEGRVAQLPRQTGSQRTLAPGLVGWSSHWQDDESFREIYVDRDMSRWQTTPPLDRRVEIATAGYMQGRINTGVDAGGISWEPPAEALANTEHAEVWLLNPAGIAIAKIEYQANRLGTWTNFAAASFFNLAGNTIASGYEEVTATFDNTLRSLSFATARRNVMTRVITTAAFTPAAGVQQSISKFAEYGNHGLTLRAISGEPSGVYASDVIADVITRAAPKLRFTTGPSGTIQPTTFAIPHLAFPDPTTAWDVISRANAYHGWDPLVWEDRTFYYQPAGTGIQWRARLADGAHLALEGDTAEQIINGVIVTYQENGVTAKTAGPPGSGCDVTDATLQDKASDNPVNAWGLKRWPRLTLSSPATDAGAVALGALYMAERNLASRRGQLTLTGSVRHPTEGMTPVWRVRSGDTILLTDRPGDIPRRIIDTSYNHATRTLTASLDSTAHKLDALLERLGVVTGGIVG